MITFKTGNLFDSEAGALVNAVNCVGVMGAGIALQFKNRYPVMYRDYVIACRGGDVAPGRPHVYRCLSGLWIINLPTKEHWRAPSEPQHIEQSLRWFAEHYHELDISSAAFPALGCGLGGLRWPEVQQLMMAALSELPIDIEIYKPYERSPR